MSEQPQRQIIVKKTRRRRGGDRRQLLTDVLLVLMLIPLLLMRSDVEAEPVQRSVAIHEPFYQDEFQPWPMTEETNDVPVFAWTRDSPGAMPATFPDPVENSVFVWASPLILREFAPTDSMPGGWFPMPDPIRHVPEPGTTSLLLCFGSALLLRRRRRQSTA